MTSAAHGVILVAGNAMTNASKLPMIGDVYYMQFSGDGSEQSGWRPGVVFQNNTGNRYSPNIIALPLTSCLKKAGQPTHVVLTAASTGLPRDSMVLCENPERMSKQKLGRYITTLQYDAMAQIAEASLLASSAIAFLEEDVLYDIWLRARSLNAVYTA